MGELTRWPRCLPPEHIATGVDGGCYCGAVLQTEDVSVSRDFPKGDTGPKADTPTAGGEPHGNATGVRAPGSQSPPASSLEKK